MSKNITFAFTWINTLIGVSQKFCLKVINIQHCWQTVWNKQVFLFVITGELRICAWRPPGAAVQKDINLSHIFKFSVFLVFTQEARLLTPLKFPCACMKNGSSGSLLSFYLSSCPQLSLVFQKCVVSLLFHSLINLSSDSMSLFKVYMYFLSSYFYTSPEEWKVNESIIHVLSLVRTPHTTFSMNKWAGKWKDISLFHKLIVISSWYMSTLAFRISHCFSLCYFVFHFWKFIEYRLNKMIATFLCLHFFHSSDQELVFSKEAGIKSVDQKIQQHNYNFFESL